MEHDQETAAWAPKAPRAQLVLKALMIIGDVSDQLEAAMVLGLIADQEPDDETECWRMGKTKLSRKTRATTAGRRRGLRKRSGSR